MKKIILLSLISGMFFVSCKDDAAPTPTPEPGSSIAQEQKAPGFYFSGNWCGPCGQYGKPALAAMGTTYKDKFPYISCQLNGGAKDPFNCSDADALAGAFNVSGVPIIHVGANGDPFQNAGGGTAMQSTLEGYIKANTAKTAKANIGLTYKIEDGAINVTTEVKYFAETEAEQLISVYIVEELVGNQYSSSGGWLKDVTFHNVLRKKLSANVTGDALPAGKKAVGSIDKMTYGDFIESTWNKDNLKVVAVLWTKNGTKVSAVNATIK